MNPDKIQLLHKQADINEDEKTIVRPRCLAAESEKEETTERKTDEVSSNARYKMSPEVPVKRLPKAIVIGVRKGGTRALLKFLCLHPNVEGAGPEPHFFNRNYEKGLNWYRELMPFTYSDQITIEKTPAYFITDEVPERIYHMDPSVKLLLIVRDPVTRVISDYTQIASKSKRDRPPFEDKAMADIHSGLVNTSWKAIQISMYAKHMERWLHVFPLKQIHLVDGEKLITEPSKELALVEEFLGLPKFINEKHFYLNAFKGRFPCINVDGKPEALGETKGRDHPKVKEEVLQRLTDFYRPLNAQFYQMVGRDFGWPS